ncbi:MAG: cyanophycinase [Sphingobacteriales bacterium]|nr:MAG: cyanophycinase [Sphingobacteriales bacterium]
MATPKGTLLIIGGHEEKNLDGTAPEILLRQSNPQRFSILGKLLQTKPGAHHDIQIIASASTIPREMEKLYRQAYQSVGFGEVSFIHMDCTEDACNEAAIQRINYSHAVFFTGGDQLRLMDHMRDTPMLDAIQKKYYSDPNFIVAGTSAGAMAIPKKIIGRGRIEESLMKEDLVMSTGLGLIEKMIVDTHFVARGRFGRLALAVAMNPDCIGVGLGEDAALMIKGGNEATSIGSGMIIVIDPQDMGATNAPYAAPNDQIVIENLRVHILAGGSKYLIQDRKFMLGDTQMERNAAPAVPKVPEGDVDQLKLSKEDQQTLTDHQTPQEEAENTADSK